MKVIMQQERRAPGTVRQRFDAVLFNNDGQFSVCKSDAPLFAVCCKLFSL